MQKGSYQYLDTSLRFGYNEGAEGGLGAPGILGAPGMFDAAASIKSASVAPQPEQTLAVMGFDLPHLGHTMAPGAAAGGSVGSFALQNGHTTGLKFGDTIFLPHSGQSCGPVVVSGGLKHIINPFLS